MELRNYGTFLRRRLFFLLAGTLTVAGFSFFVANFMVPIYAATTTVLVEQGVDPRADPVGSLESSRRSAITYEALLLEHPLLEQVVQDLTLPISPNTLRRNMSVRTRLNTGLIDITVEDSDPVRAASIANKIAEVFITENIAREQAKFEVARQQLQSENEVLVARIEEVQTALVTLESTPEARGIEVPAYIRVETARLQSELTTLQTQYSILLTSAESFRLAATRMSQNLSVVSPAVVPRTPVRPNVPLATALGAIAGLVLSLGIAAILEYMDDTIKTEDDVTRLLQMPVLGSVGKQEAATSYEQIINLSTEGRLEAFRVLRTNLELAYVDKPIHRLLVTSAQTGDGKSVICINLASVWAQGGKEVILVDTDLRRPSLQRLLHVSPEPGLTNLILDSSLDAASVLHPTDIPNLRLVPSGPIPPNPSELLNSNRMRQIVNALSQRADIVILDSPPVLPVADSAIISSWADGVLFVIEAERTRTEIVRRAAASLSTVGGSLLGVALNKVPLRAGYGRYHYYSGRYDGADGDYRHGRRRDPLRRLIDATLEMPKRIRKGDNGRRNLSTPSTPASIGDRKENER